MFVFVVDGQIEAELEDQRGLSAVLETRGSPVRTVVPKVEYIVFLTDHGAVSRFCS